jgi:hypothetical protein
LQDDAGQVRQGLTAGLAQLGSNGVSPLRVQICERAAGHGVERLQHCDHMPRIAPNALQNVAEDCVITGTRHTIFGAGRDHHLGKASQGAALIG